MYLGADGSGALAPGCKRKSRIDARFSDCDNQNKKTPSSAARTNEILTPAVTSTAQLSENVRESPVGLSQYGAVPLWMT